MSSNNSAFSFDDISIGEISGYGANAEKATTRGEVDERIEHETPMKYETKNLKNKVQVELPKELFESSLKPTGMSPPRNQDLESEESSFIPVRRLENLCMFSNNQASDSASVASSVSGWTAIPSGGDTMQSQASASVTSYSYQSYHSRPSSLRRTDASTMCPSIASSSNNSVISGFDMLNLYGQSIRKCHACRYENEPNAGICKGCGRALVPNPNIFLDQELQASLQQKEERTLWYQLQKRKTLSELSIREQSDIWAKEVHQDIRYSTGIMPVPEINLQMAMDRFLNSVRRRMDEKCTMRLGFVFTSKKPGYMKRIQLSGFGTCKQRSSIPVFASADEAFGYWVDYQAGGKQGHLTHSIAEEGKRGYRFFDMPIPDPKACVGWIVVIFPGTEHEFRYSHQQIEGHVNETVSSLHCPGTTYNACTIQGEGACLPILFFDAELRNSDAFAKTLHSLEQKFLDFMEDIRKPAESLASFLTPKPEQKEKAKDDKVASMDLDTKKTSANTSVANPNATGIHETAVSSTMSDEEILVGGHKMRFCKSCDALIGLFASCRKCCEMQYADKACPHAMLDEAFSQDSKMDIHQARPTQSVVEQERNGDGDDFEPINAWSNGYPDRSSMSDVIFLDVSKVRSNQSNSESQACFSSPGKSHCANDAADNQKKRTAETTQTDNESPTKRHAPSLLVNESSLDSSCFLTTEDDKKIRRTFSANSFFYRKKSLNDEA